MQLNEQQAKMLASILEYITESEADDYAATCADNPDAAEFHIYALAVNLAESINI